MREKEIITKIKTEIGSAFVGKEELIKRLC